jgi:hypothetical protein
MKITEQDREQGKIDAAHAKQERKMSDKQAERLRAIGEQEKAARASVRVFLDKFNQLERDTWTMMQLLKRLTPASDIEPSVLDLERRANKLRLKLAQGAKITQPNDVLMVATLTDAERRMSDENFVEAISKEWPVIEPELCKADKLCFRYEGRKAAPRKGSSEFCGRTCSDAFKIRSKRAEAVLASA